MQLTAATLGIPVAVAGVYSVYNTYFSPTTACQNLRATIIATMEKNLSADAKAALLKKDIAEFEKACGVIDPDAKTIFVAALQQLEAQGAGPAASASGAKSRSVFPPLASFETMQNQTGWVALGRRDVSGGELNFAGLSDSTTDLPQKGAILTARWPLPVWAEPPTGRPDLTAARALVQAGACVRVVSTRAASERVWIEVAPAPCS
jgi:hypothetical protein